MKEADRSVRGGDENFKPLTEGTEPLGACWLP